MTLPNFIYISSLTFELQREQTKRDQIHINKKFGNERSNQFDLKQKLSF